MVNRDLLLGAGGELVIRNGTFLTGESLTQEVAVLMLTCKGELKADPLTGCDLVRRTNARLTTSQLHALVRVQLERDGKDFDRLQAGINLMANG